MKPEFAVALELRESGARVDQEADRGTGLFLMEEVSAGSRILTFGGPLLSRPEYESCPDFEHCVQVGVDAFLGPSGDLDDYTNHSCSPSAKVEITESGGGASLVALRDLYPGDEVTFDYSSVQLGDLRFRLANCQCAEPGCRGVVEDFTLMSWRDRERLYSAGLCVTYVAEEFLRQRCERGSSGPGLPRK